MVTYGSYFFGAPNSSPLGSQTRIGRQLIVNLPPVPDHMKTLPKVTYVNVIGNRW
jgi:hypothetical protein